jgi:FkbM family methyltransferase
LRKNYRKLLSDLRWFAPKLGFSQSIFSFYSYFLQNTKLKKIYYQNLPKPFYLRPRTSDIGVFRQIILGDAYKISENMSPRFIIDGGANIGLASLYFHNLYPSATILAVEPEPSNYQLLKLNVAAYPQILAIHAALWTRHQKLRIQNEGANKWEFRVEPADSGEHIHAYTISDLLCIAKSEVIDILKLDIEGAEYELFSKGYEGWIDKVKIIMIELHDYIHPDCSAVFERAISGLSFRRYRISEHLVLVRDDWLS